MKWSDRTRLRREWLWHEFRKDSACDMCGCECKAPGDDAQGVATVDHIAPTSQGGVDHPLNYALLCRECNIAKADSFVVPRRHGHRSTSWAPMEQARKPTLADLLNAAQLSKNEPHKRRFRARSGAAL